MNIKDQITIYKKKLIIIFNEYIPHWIEDITIWFKRKLDKILHSNMWQLAGMLIAIGFFCFIATYINNMLTIPLGGDYVLQEIPFIYNGYDDWMHYFETGEFVLWDTSGFLGVNNIGANCFYYLTSPWFLIYLLFPRSILSQVQGVLFIVKMMTSGLLFYLYLGSFKIQERTKKAGAIAYAFCGWMFYNLWFHFIDAAVFLPLLLLGIEKVFKKEGPMVLILAITLLGLTSYFFVASFCLSSMCYVVFRLFQILKGKKMKDILVYFRDGVAGYALGLALVAIVLLPSIMAVQEMPRVAGSSYLDTLANAKGFVDKLKVLFVFPTPYEAIYPLTTFLFMNINCFSSNLFNPSYYNNTMSSIFVFTPFTLMLVPGILQAIKDRKWSYIVGVVAVCLMLFTPFCYYLFHAFTLGYGRWQVMAAAWMIPFFCITFDKRKKMPKTYLDISIVFTLVLMLVALLLSQRIQKENPNMFNPEDGRWIIAPLQMAYAFVVYVIMRTQFRKNRMSDILIVLISFEAVVMGNVTIQVHGLQTYQHLAGGIENVKTEEKIMALLNKYDDSFYRTYSSTADRGANNHAMRIGANGVGTFHSVYPFQADDLIDWSRINYNKSWSMSYNEKRYNLDALLGIKYSLLKKDDVNIPYGYEQVYFQNSEGNDKLEEFQNNLAEYKSHRLYENTNFVDTFFVYDDVMESSYLRVPSYHSIDEDINESHYLKHAIIDSDVYASLKDEDPDLYQLINTKMISRTAANADTNQIVNPGYRLNVAIAQYDDNGNYVSGKEEGIEEYPDYINPADEVYTYSNYVASGENSSVSVLSKLQFDLTTPICPNADPNDPSTGCYVSVGARFGYNFRFYLFGEPKFDSTGKEVFSDPLVWDNHYWNGYGNKQSDWKFTRGFYTKNPIYSVVGIFYDNIPTLSSLGSGLTTPIVRYTENKYYQADIDRLQEENKHFEIIDRSANKMTFTTDYTDDGFHYTVINQPMDRGWSLKKTYNKKVCENNSCETKPVTEDVKILKSQGGLIGFIADSTEDGSKITYTLDYMPVGLELGRVASIIGLIGTGFLSGVYISIRRNKKFQNQKIFTLKDDYFDKKPWEKKKKIKRKKLPKHKLS